MIQSLLLLLLISSCPAASAIDLPLPGAGAVALRAYYKNFLLLLDSPQPEIGDGVEDLNRARLMVDASWPGIADVSLHYEHYAVVNPVPLADLFVGPASVERPGIWDLRWTIYEDANVVWQHDLDRLSVRRRFGRADVTVGRQAIGWAVGLIWSPNDLFAPFSPVEIDRDYRLGIDAARALVSLGAFGELDTVYAFYDADFDDHVLIGRWQRRLAPANAAVGLMGGKFLSDAVVGVLATGELRGVGLHGECTFTHDFDDDHAPFGPASFFRAVAGADYRFSGDVVALAEYYFNGYGTADPDQYILRAVSPRVARGELFNVGRHYLGFVADWRVHRRLHLIGQGQWNLTDPSAQVGPALTLALAGGAELVAGAYFGLGSKPENLFPRSEFGSLPDVYYVAAKLYF
jgi:hypothetical protein